MKAFLHILKRRLCEKYQDITFEFYPSRRTKNVHMGQNCSLLTLREHEQIFSDAKEIWLLKRQDTKFKFAMPQLIHMTKWKFDYIIFRRNIDFKKNVYRI